MLFPSFAAKKWTVLKLISWKHSFRKLNEENEMAKKKKQALDNLLNTGRISQSTYDLFNSEIDEGIAEIERQQKGLLEKMNSKMEELEEQIKTLEMLLANFEIQHVTGEVDDEVYQSEIGVLSMGIETAKHELDVVREAVNQLSSGMQISSTEVAVEQKMEPQSAENEVSEPKVEVVEEKLSESPVEPVVVKEVDSFQAQQENKQETSQSTKESQSTETVAEGEEKQEA
jgi:Arc/MetJ-type ribon-helix-helix transcriptional regulator